MRVVAAGMWYLGTLWKLPWPVAAGFHYWLGATVKYSSFALQADIMQIFRGSHRPDPTADLSPGSVFLPRP